jgi:hypothetical protein
MARVGQGAHDCAAPRLLGLAPVAREVDLPDQEVVRAGVGQCFDRGRERGHRFGDRPRVERVVRRQQWMVGAQPPLDRLRESGKGQPVALGVVTQQGRFGSGLGDRADPSSGGPACGREHAEEFDHLRQVVHLEDTVGAQHGTPCRSTTRPRRSSG